MADGSSYPNFYIADSENNNKVYFDMIPTPPYFEPVPPRQQQSFQCILGYTGSSLVAGQKVHFDAGTHYTGCVHILRLPYMTEATLTDLKAKYMVLENVVFSPDAGVSGYTCQWAPSGLNVNRNAGRQSYNVTIKLIEVNRTWPL